MKNNKHIVILGGGLAGLAAGYELTKKGFNITVLEKWEDVGGLARTLEHKGFKFDTGPHRWYTKSDMVNTWMLDLLGKDVVKVPRLTRIFFDKKYFYYPIKFKNAILGIGLYKSSLAVFDYFMARFKARVLPQKLTTMEDGYINQFGKTLFEIFFKRYSEKLWGRDCQEISVDWVGQRTRGLSITTLIKESLFKSNKVVSLVDEFSYPKDGVGQIAYKMRDGIKKQNGKIILNAEVVKVYHEDKKIITVDYLQNGKRFSIKGDQFISSIPINDLINILTPKPPAEIVKLADKLEYRDELQVTLFVNKTKITPDTWVYVHPKNISFMRFMEMDNWSPTLSPKGKTSIVFEIACTEGDAMWRRSDSSVIELVKKDFIEEFDLVTESDIIGGFVHRVPKEYPVYHINYKEDVDKIKKYASIFSNLQLIGRNGTFRYNNMDHSIEMGLYSAWNIIHGRKKYDIESVNIEREYLEEKKIENLEDEKVEES